MELQEEVERVGAKESITERARERPREGNLAGASLVPGIPTQARERKRQICFCPGGEEGRSGPAGGPESRSDFGRGRRASVCVCLRLCI